MNVEVHYIYNALWKKKFARLDSPEYNKLQLFVFKLRIPKDVLFDLLYIADLKVAVSLDSGSNWSSKMMMYIH